MRVPFVDLPAQSRALAVEVDAALHRVISRADFILGEELDLFEKEFASYCGAKHAIGVDSGGSALELALRACGIGPGNEVITVSHTYAATVFAISATGATPVLVDINPASYTIDPSRLEAAITPRTSAILPVHIYGQAADMNGILAMARKHRLLVIEDACQAHGARYGDQRVGALGDAGCFSFYPAKNIGAYGDGGLVVTNNAEIAEKIRMLRHYGQREKSRHVAVGYNRRLDTLQAAILRVKLPRLEDWNASRRRAAKLYDELLKEVEGIVTPAPPVGEPDSHVHHLYVVQHPRRDALASHLRASGIETGIHYPLPVHRQPCYENSGIRHGPLPVTESIAPRILSLPMFPEITSDQVEYVCWTIQEFVAESRDGSRET
jgi:dTDP-4-amino-4,6-dideoxygalactose transaminase